LIPKLLGIIILIIAILYLIWPIDIIPDIIPIIGWIDDVIVLIVGVFALIKSP